MSLVEMRILRWISGNKMRFEKWGKFFEDRCGPYWWDDERERERERERRLR